MDERRTVQTPDRRKPLRIESPLSPELDALVYQLIGIGMQVHSAFGPGLREGNGRCPLRSTTRGGPFGPFASIWLCRGK
jgi:hypothetical protein